MGFFVKGAYSGYVRKEFEMCSLDITYDAISQVTVEGDVAEVYLDNLIAEPLGELDADAHISYKNPMTFKRDGSQWKITKEGLNFGLIEYGVPIEYPAQ